MPTSIATKYHISVAIPALSSVSADLLYVLFNTDGNDNPTQNVLGLVGHVHILAYNCACEHLDLT